VLAFSELERIALLGASVSIIVAVVTLIGVVYQSHKTRAELTPGNGHTIGRAVARIEEMLWRHEHRLDSLELEVRATKEVTQETKVAVDEVAPLVAQQVSDQMKEDS
jgi:hypothetical protein